ncbi:hypothetical protein GCM10025782_20150 [Pedococcus ginsenosidimutans]|uniref:Vitamin K epoxide reductase domain-containing protein n=1 Tax=Pedococcus ginsenosidimutans TaxID=490570 RepID=A0ABP8Y582_9MICO
MTKGVESSTMESPPAAPSGAGPRHRVRGLVAVLLGFALTFVGAFWTGFGGAQLGHVLTRQRDIVTMTQAPSWTWAVLTALTTAGLGLLSWSSGMRSSSLRSASPADAGTGRPVVAAAGSLWTLAWLGAFSLVGAQFEVTGPRDRCARSSCWPHGWQELAVATPLLVASLVLLGAGLLARRAPRAVALVAPPATYLVLTLVQVAAWDGMVVPFLTGPPPFSS